MADKPEALRLADWIEGDMSCQGDAEIAAELRRLHEAHEWQYKVAGDRLRRIEKLETVNHELLEALRLTSIDCQYLHHAHKDRHLLFEECPVVARINAAIRARGSK